MDKNQIKGKMIAVTAMLLAVLLCCKRWTGEGWHNIFALLLLCTTAMHVCGHKRKPKDVKKAVQTTNRILLFLFCAAFVTGILLHPFREMFLLAVLHKISSGLFVLGGIVHALQHRTAEKYLKEPAEDITESMQ